MDPAEEVAKHNGKRSFRTYTLDRFQLLVCQQHRREVAEVEIVLDDQYGSALC
jgi:hypothetical protein